MYNINENVERMKEKNLEKIRRRRERERLFGCRATTTT